ncbi:hypothetical protein FG87_31885 [Nocardia vulneris]|uniref:Uncharacterized protein n=1 Tax=Nocardia vulneris TaxID=1141657 RepID=A0ABR4Z869_9NOCA|nr:hypothetical protein FG87_31885 [Nocardia vulneris]
MELRWRVRSRQQHRASQVALTVSERTCALTPLDVYLSIVGHHSVSKFEVYGVRLEGLTDCGLSQFWNISGDGLDQEAFRLCRAVGWIQSRQRRS